jgi:hypothetical protein
MRLSRLGLLNAAAHSSVDDDLEPAEDHPLAVEGHRNRIRLHARAAMIFFMAALRVSRDGQRIQENTTVSSGFRLIAIGNVASLPAARHALGAEANWSADPAPIPELSKSLGRAAFVPVEAAQSWA